MDYKIKYVRDEKRRPVVTECFAFDEAVFMCKTMAICNEKDTPNKKFGVNLAIRRAEQYITKDKESQKAVFLRTLTRKVTPRWLRVLLPPLFTRASANHRVPLVQTDYELMTDDDKKFIDRVIERKLSAAT